MIARFEDTRDIRLLGAYQPGVDVDLDLAVRQVPLIYEVLAQSPKDGAAYDAFSDTLGKVEERFGPDSRASLELLCAMGEEYSRRGSIVTAEALFQQAVSRRPSYVPGLLGLARTLRQAGADAEAVKRYEDVVRLEPENSSARQELAALLAKSAKGNQR